nr:translation initiation factor IF-2-like [Taeniopygia guttata]
MAAAPGAAAAAPAPAPAPGRGHRDTGDRDTGDRAAGTEPRAPRHRGPSRGHRDTGDRAAGNRDTGDRAAGDRAAGHRAPGARVAEPVAEHSGDALSRGQTQPLLLSLPPSCGSRVKVCVSNSGADGSGQPSAQLCNAASDTDPCAPWTGMRDASVTSPPVRLPKVSRLIGTRIFYKERHCSFAQ